MILLKLGQLQIVQNQIEVIFHLLCFQVHVSRLEEFQ